MDAFHTLAEIAVAIAGFSSLVIIFRGNMSDWNRQDYVSLAFALSWSIGSVFLSLTPIVLAEFGADLANAARLGLFGAVTYMLVIGGVLTYARLQIEAKGGGHLQFSPALSLLYLLIVVGALAAGLGLLPGPAHAWFIVTIMLLMAHATAELGLFVIQTVRRAPD